MTDLADLARLQGHLKTIVATRKRLDAMNDRDLMSMTPKQAQKLWADRSWLCMALDKAEREAHAAAVDCGIADPRPVDQYGPVEYRPSAFHHYRHQPTVPRSRQVAA